MLLANAIRTSPLMRAGRALNLPLLDPTIEEKAGLAWTVSKVDLFTADMVSVDTHRAIKRDDTGTIMGVVGKGYEIVQNADGFGWSRNVAGINQAVVERAGERDGGRTTWMLLSIPGMELELGQDRSQGHILFTNSHDGGGSVKIQPYMLRLVCTNGLRMMAGGSMSGTLSSGYSVRHTAGVHDALRSIANAYARTLRDFDATREAYQSLAQKRATADTLAAIIAAAFPIVKEGEDETERARTIRRDRERAIDVIRRSATCQVEGTAGTVFADLNAVTEFIDHGGSVGTRFTAKQEDARFGAAYFGAGDEAKGRAWNAALALV